MLNAPSHVLLYSSPILLNGLLFLLWYIKEKTSHYTQIAQGLDLLVGMLAAGFLLNTAAGIFAAVHGHYLLAAAYLGVVVLLIAFVLLLRRG